MVVTELEVVTLAFSSLAMMIYFLWWNKPLDVGVPARVYLENGFTVEDVSKEMGWDDVEVSDGNAGKTISSQEEVARGPGRSPTAIQPESNAEVLSRKPQSWRRRPSRNFIEC